ncbi:PilZ domain-containing protein [Pelagibacterium xiamenense]|uniref:PilZ domain-containing protein n=1 Tax=Pelagibacterium xiamenense TaxID=2901140 RepID=UPI001E43D2CF|nr:PilZ domain-containing protein [Pelagibacterium xiamenense]MCD7058613.1 PilZ domain-containing protein [Pelagibacterium xiamenense]
MQANPPGAPDERLRVFATLSASYTVAGAGSEVHRCRTRSIALDRIVIEAEGAPPQNAKVFLNIPGLGICSGQVSKTMPNGFVVAIALDTRAVAKLMPRLGWLKRFLARDTDNRRAHPRHLMPPYPVTLRGDDGFHAEATLYDLSCSGLAVMTDAQPDLGARLTLGGISGTVVRYFEGGLAICFDAPRPLEDLRERLFPHPQI